VKESGAPCASMVETSMRAPAIFSVASVCASFQT